MKGRNPPSNSASPPGEDRTILNWGSKVPVLPPRRASMAAEVLGCGHAHHLMEVDYMAGSPQVHLHFLTEDSEFEENGYGRVELCCHGCGDSILVLYEDERSKTRHLKIRNEFHEKHKCCPNRTYETSCPSYRRTAEIVDLRLARRKRSQRQRAFA